MSASDFLLLLSQRTAVRPAIPTSVNLKEWLRADAGTWQDAALTIPASIDGQPVHGWVEQSTAGKNALQSGADSAAPVLKLGANGIGGRPALSFDGGDWLVTAAFTAALTQPITIYVVVQFANVAAGAKLVYDGIGGSNRASFGVSIATAGKYGMLSGTPVEEASADATTTGIVVASIYNNFSSQTWVNNVSKITGTTGNQSLTGLTVGAGFNAASGLVGLLGDLLVRSGADDAATRAVFQSWLATWYGIALS